MFNYPDITGWGLGKGESEVISYAIANAGYEAVLDNLEARKCAVTFNIPLRGTVCIILLAKKINIILLRPHLLFLLERRMARKNPLVRRKVTMSSKSPYKTYR